MGLIASSFRVMYLTAYQISLESKIQWIASAKLELSASADEILALGNDLDPENPAVKQMEARRDKLMLLEKKLNLQQEEYQNRLKMVTVELESVKKAVDTEIKKSFSYDFG
jgi:DNA repair ATPase RecN